MELDSNLLDDSILTARKPLTPKPLAPSEPKEDELREFGDIGRTRTAIYTNVLKATQAIQPVSNGRHTLRLTNVAYQDPDRFSKQQQKQAILNRQTLARRMQGVWELVDDATGDVIDRKKSVIMSVPHMTERGTFINKGTEYALKNQQRLLPGIYTRIRDNGEIESHANILPGVGQAHRYYLDPAKGMFRIKVGQGTVGIMPLLKAMGATKEQLLEAWGRDLYASNFTADDPQEYKKLKEKFLSAKEMQGDENQQREALVKKFHDMRVDPEVTKRTLGKEYNNLSLDTLLDITKKLIRVSKKEDDPDDRDSLPFQQFYGPEDLFAERIARDKDNLRRTLLWKASQRGSLKNMPSSALNKQLHAALLHSGLGIAAEEINTAELLDKATAVTRLGEGGIPSLDSIPDEARSVQPSMFGFIDPLRTPESGRAGVDTFLARGARKGPNNKLYVKFNDARTGKPVYKTPQQLSDLTIGFPKSLERDLPRVVAMRGGKMVYVPKKDIDLVLPSMEDALNPLSNLIPNKSQVKGQRLVMASRMTTQALPVVDAESPLVQTAVPGTNRLQSFEEAYADKMGALKAQKNGRVLSVSPDEIKVQYEDGTTDTLDIYNNFPLNRKTRIHQDPVVQPGQTFTANQLLAKSNYTDKTGATALGRNARTAYMVWEGKNFEDAVVISKSFAKKMTSEHIYQHELETNDKTSIGKKKYIQHFPSKYDKKTLENLDDNGVIKPGTEVKYGDPLILGISQKDVAHNRVHKQGQVSYADSTVNWEHHDPGIVTDVVMSKNGPAVIVKSLAEMRIGDKLSGRFGDKGILADIIDDEAMPKDAQGRPFEVLANPLGLVTRVNPGQMAELWLGKLAELQGKPFKVEDFDDSKDLINWVKEQLQQNNLKALEDVFDPKNDKKISNIATGNRFFMKLHHMAEAKSQGRSGGAYTAEGAPAKGGVEGCFAPKQNILTIQGYKNISEICEKKLGVQVRTFSESLKEWVYRPVVDWFTYRAKVDDLLSVHTIGGPCEKDSRTNRTHSVMYMTKNHYVFTYDGRKVTANELTINDKLVTWGPIPTEDQKAFIAGTLLGDATADFNGISFEHSVKQIEYVNWKSYVLNGLNAKSCDTVHDMSQNPDFKTKRCLAKVVWIAETHVCDYYTKLCYDNNHIKRVTPEWLAQLNDLSIAMWVLDDGSISNRAKKKGRINYTGNIATHGFDYESKQLLVDWLNNRLATDCIINAVGAINLTSDACRKLIPIIAKYVPWEVIPKSKKFLIKEVMKLQKVQPPTKLNTTCELGKVPLIISKIEKYKHDKPDVTEINVYDFTVKDTHTYVASHALVSNSKRIGILESNALLAHGATDTLQDVISVRSNKNQDYWLQYMQGYNPKIEKVPYAYEKFVNQLKASGVNVVRKGSQQHIMALTDKDIDELAGDRELTNASGVDWGRGLQELPGGLFDKSKTGGHGGNQWSYFKLHEPMPNPVMEEPIRRILGLTQAKFEGILSGETQLDKYGTGPQAIKKALENINIAKEIELARNVMNGGKASQRDAAVRKLGYLKAAQKLGLSLADYTLTKVPVIPPSFRPVSVMSNDMPLVNDANYLYKELFEANENLKKIQANLGTEASGAERLATYRAFKAVTGLGDPIGVKTQEKNIQGFLKNVFGSSPKFGVLQRKLISTTVDNVGRGVISPDPNLDMDQVGIPEDKAFKIYERFVTRNLVRRGMSLREAREAVKNKTKVAREMLNEEMERRPVYISRAPVLHKFGILAAKPQITKGDVLRVSPLVVKGFGADFDGNCCDYDTELYLQVDSSLLGLWSVDQFQSWESLIMRTCGTTLLDVAGENKSFKVKIGDIPRQGKGFKGKDGQTIYNLPEGLSVLSYGPETCKPIYTPITKITIDENHACREVKTRSGRSVIVSDNESLCVFDTELGQVRKMKPTDAVGKLSPYVKQYPIVGNQFSFELGWWYAVLAADGWKQEFLVGYSKNDTASRKEFERIARECILDAFNVNEYSDKDRANKFGDSVKIHLSGKHFVKKVLDVVHPDHKDHPEDRAALYKKLPDVLLYNGSRECLLGLLSGAIDGDASVGWNTTNKNRRFFCRFNTSSPYLVESYKELLARLGVRYSVTVTPAKGQSKTSYTVCPSVTDLFKILPECRLVNAERKAIIDEFLATTESLKDDLDIVPISSGLANILSKLLIQQKNLYGLLRSAVSSGKLGRGTAKKVLELVPELDHDHYMIFTHIVNGDHIHWDPIVSATEVEARDVFDLEVPETKVFSANNGLIIWDTMNYHVPSTDAAVKEAYERLLPSKNLFSLADFKSVMHKPANEYITGLYFATQPSSDKPTRIFRNKSDMMKAYESGAIDYNDKIRILEP